MGDSGFQYCIVRLGSALSIISAGSLILYFNDYCLQKHINVFINNPCFPSAFICDTLPDLKLVTKGGIKPELCSLSYASIDDAVATVAKLGRGTMLAVLDLKYAYQIVPVYPDDRWLLGMDGR